MSSALHFKITNLYNKNDFSLDFDNKLNVLIGENGCGKSTIINIIYHIAKKDFAFLDKIEFDYIELLIDDCLINIKHEDITQLSISKNPDFRETVLKFNFSSVNSFEEYYEKIINANMRGYAYTVKDEPYIDCIKEDLFYCDENYYNFMSKYKIVYGSKLYLKCVYSYFKGENPFENLEKIVSNVEMYSFVDIEKTDELNVSMTEEQEERCIEYLEKYLTDKEISFKDKSLIVRDKETLDEIDEKNLSSGERKIIKILELIAITGENDFLLLDEPELSLSIYWQRFLIEDLLSYCKAKKIIIATQSPNLLNVSELDYLIPIYSDVIDYDE